MKKIAMLLNLLLLPALSACHADAPARAPDGHARANCRGSCPPSTALPACAKDVGARPLADVLGHEPAFAGQTIALQGPLQKLPAICTVMFCPARCCNHCGARLVLAESSALAAAPSPVEREKVVLALEGTGLACSGDESAVCCDVEARGQSVVARGTLKPLGSGWVLADAQLCTP